MIDNPIKNIFVLPDTLLPNSDTIAKTNAVSVATGIAQPTIPSG